MLFNEIEQLTKKRGTSDVWLKQMNLIDKIKKTKEYDTLTKNRKTYLNVWWYDASSALEQMMYAEADEDGE